jgi:16S rRNA G1207 methylase RsmC
MQRKEQESERRQSFVDLGCGNGLLVHILQSEGVKYILIKKSTDE